MNASTTTKKKCATSTRDFDGDARLIEVRRGEFVESVHRGAIAVVDSVGALVAGVGDVTQPVFLRSGAKPFQVIPAILAGGIERYGITVPELAVMCSSHSGEPRHTAAVQSVLAKIELDESALRCGTHAPLSVGAAAARWRNGLEPTPACNNCSGAHAGMLVACRAEGWSTQNYGDPDHPLQRRIREVVLAFAGVAPGELQEATDTCAVPTFRLPLIRAAAMFARLASGQGISETLSDAATSVRTAMTACPEMVGGERRLDSDLMRGAAGRLVAKGGAEGFQGVGDARTGKGLALKIADGGAVAAAAAALRALEDADMLHPDALRALDDYQSPRVLTLEGDVAGQVVVVFHLGKLE